jgi:5-formyltetrahydrofolate cyclo-ligase
MRAILEESKNVLRRTMVSRRRSLPSARCRLWSRSIQLAALESSQYVAARKVALYSPVENEVSTDVIRTDALENGKMVFYPKMDHGDSPWFFQISPSAELRVGRTKIPEPPGTNALSLGDRGSSQDLIVFVPGVAFDLRGYRLGRGRGWYDRVLATLKGRGIFIGLAYECQIVDRLATETWDQQVHYVITEKRIVACDASAPHGVQDRI